MKVRAVLDVLIDIVNDVFGEGRSQNAAVAQRPVAEFSPPLAPRHNLVVRQNLYALLYYNFR